MVDKSDEADKTRPMPDQVPHTFEIYSGNHGNRVPERVEMKVLPFFSQRLEKARDGRKH